VTESCRCLWVPCAAGNQWQCSDNDNHKAIDVIQEWNFARIHYIILDSVTQYPAAAGERYRLSTRYLGHLGYDWTLSQRQAAHAADGRHARWYFQVQNPNADDIAAGGHLYHDSRNFGTTSGCLSARQELAEVTVAGTRLYLAESTTEQDFVNIGHSKKAGTKRFSWINPNLQAWATAILSEEAL
jgi:hypothetical protein